uniref:tRNA-dihydrouridine(47) synthase [NAD(P)(+)] n=1 Tax=Rhodosorus marinus TaxID=101924 RepID=A0A7S3A1H6_9RHOD|mmetsp:Transcript_41273/g.162735  ORF Transcript_41273/g.162735 Transcript_41273/m.162735 type:complete len:403 (+) Transcript_41273:909-2117(+)
MRSSEPRVAFATSLRCSLGGGDGGVSELRKDLKDQLVLAPLTKGGNYAFRRLCTEFGAKVTVSEMAYARKVGKGDRKERTLFVRSENEGIFGAQIATNNCAEAVSACNYARENGAKFLDLNCGCPIREVTRRGLGSALMRKPPKLVALVERMVSECSLPVTVKIRTGLEEDADAEKVLELVRDLGRVGASAVTIHGRTAQQRYSGNANWDLISKVSAESGVDVIGNGDILTAYEAKDRLADSGCLAVMTGRGALIKPWLFSEFEKDYTWNPTPMERIGVYRTLVRFMKERFRDDEKGRLRSFEFLRFHMDFFSRYRYYPEEEYRERSREYPLIQQREKVDLGFRDADVSPIEVLLQRPVDTVNLDALIGILWDSRSDHEATRLFEEEALSLRKQTLACSAGG